MIKPLTKFILNDIVRVLEECEVPERADDKFKENEMNIIKLGSQRDLANTFLIERSGGTKYNEVDYTSDFDNDGNYYIALLLEKNKKWWVAVGYDRNVDSVVTQYTMYKENSEKEARAFFGMIEADTIALVEYYFFSH